MTVEYWNNLLSGLAGAVIGSVLGFLGSVFLDWKAKRSNRKAAGRAVLAEMEMNVQALQVAVQHPPVQVPQISSDVFSKNLPLVAQMLDWSVLQEIVKAYDYAAEVVAEFRWAKEVDDLIKAETGFRSRSGTKFDEDRKTILNNAGNNFSEAQRRLKCAAVPLRRRVLTRGESKRFAP